MYSIAPGVGWRHDMASGAGATASTGILPALLEYCCGFLLWEGRPQCDSLSHFRRHVPFYAAGMEGREDTGSVARFDPQDPGGGGGCSTDHRSPGRGEYCDEEFTRVARRGTTIGALAGFGGVGRGSVC